MAANRLSRPALVVPVSPGELLDKIAILEIKKERIRDAAKLANISAELARLKAVGQRAIPDTDEVSAFVAELKRVNETIWDAENLLRERERDKKFDSVFVDAARSIYRNNDRRSVLKRQINELLSSPIIEEKEHPRYE